MIMTSESSKSTPESKELKRQGLLQLLRVDFDQAQKIEDSHFPHREYVKYDLTADDGIPRKMILLTEKGEKMGIKSLLKTDRYYISTIDETKFPTWLLTDGQELDHSGLPETEIRHIDENGHESRFYLTGENLVSAKIGDDPNEESNQTSKEMAEATEEEPNQTQEHEVLEQLRLILSDYQPTPFTAAEE